MTTDLEISADWEALDRGSEEERACFAGLGIRRGARWLTEAHDDFVETVRKQPYLSTYRFAE